MSESGEMSEFAYIMELLARGKVSAMARGAVAWIPISDTTWPVSVGIPVIPGRGWDSRVYALSPGIPAAAECKLAFFSLLCCISEMNQGGFSGVFGANRAAAGGSRDREGRDFSVRRWGGGPGVGRGGAPGRTQGCPSVATSRGDCLSRHEARKEGPNSG